MKLNRKNNCFSPPSTLISDPNSKPISNKAKNILHIGGIQVEFPYQPYGAQLAFMNRVISTLDRAARDGGSHALLESPTGTGKTLSLLCSALAWQQHCKSRNENSNLPYTYSNPHPEAVADPINHGGGFIPETPTASSGDNEKGSAAANNGQKKTKLAPRIFYASRTHSQIKQVIQEYRKTAYRVPMAVLGSRKHYCTSMTVRGAEDINEQCKLLLKNREGSCPEFKNVHKVKGHPSLQKGGCHEVHDIEDLVKIGEVVKGCSYFAARSMAESAELVFCPYNYLISPTIRKVMDVDIEKDIVILDEAHNIEDIARDAGSVDFEEELLLQLETELGQLRLDNPVVYQPLQETIQELLSWMDRQKNGLEKRDFQHYFSCWTGDKALSELEDANISLKSFPILHECATKAIKAASDAEPDIACLSGMASTVLEGLFSSFNFFFSENGIHASDYLLSVQRYVKKDRSSGGGWTHLLSLWCLNPAVVFSDITRLSLSVILTSGTLSPMNSFSSELGSHFGTCLEAPHVIDVDSQLWAAVISKGPDGYPLNSSFKTADSFAFQDSLGSSLEQICKVVPGGCLVFFPSYKAMDKLCIRWKETGQWDRLNAEKPLFIEPRGGDQNGLEQVLKGYYSSIHQGIRPVARSKKRAKKLEPQELESSGTFPKAKKGAAFLAVCRGKISEGIDFSDDNARVVIVVGIPFPNIRDIKVAQKKKFNDTFKSSKNLLNGSEWYCQQAFRALNQATGRCIRHRFDYGGIILLDERFCEERNKAYLSKWFRKSIRQYNSFEDSVNDLSSFFRDVKDRVGKVQKFSQHVDVEIEDISLSNDDKVTATKRNSVRVKANDPKVKLSSDTLVTQKDISLCHSNVYESFLSQGSPTVNGHTLKKEKYSTGYREYIDLECDTQNGYSCDRNMESTPFDPDLTIVRETPGLNGSPPVKLSVNLTGHECSSVRITPSIPELPGNSFSSPISVVNSSLAPKSISMVITPERLIKIEENDDDAPRTHSPYFPSVNSFFHKRRKSVNLLSESPQTIQSNTPILRTPNFATSMEEKLQISCSVCKTPLGLPDNDLVVTCSFITSSKVYLSSILKKTTLPLNKCSTDIPVIISDISSVNQSILENKDKSDKGNEVITGQGVWYKEDGCVYNTIFCPFCSESNICLGVQVMATDASNVLLQNKIMLFSSSVEIKDPGSFKVAVKDEKEENMVSGDSTCTKSEVMNSIEKFAYIPQHQHSDGWRSTKSKMQLPKRSHFSTPQG